MPAGIRAAVSHPLETSYFFLHNPRRAICPREQRVCPFIADDAFGRRIDGELLTTEAVANGRVMHEQRAEMAVFDVGVGHLASAHAIDEVLLFGRCRRRRRILALWRELTVLHQRLQTLEMTTFWWHCS